MRAHPHKQKQTWLLVFCTPVSGLNQFTRSRLVCEYECCRSVPSCVSGELDQLDQCVAALPPGCAVNEVWNWTTTDDAWCVDLYDSVNLYGMAPNSPVVTWDPPETDLVAYSDLVVTGIKTECTTLNVKPLQYDADLCTLNVPHITLASTQLLMLSEDNSVRVPRKTLKAWHQSLAPPFLLRFGLAGFENCQYHTSSLLMGSAELVRVHSVAPISIWDPVPTVQRALQVLDCPQHKLGFWRA